MSFQVFHVNFALLQAGPNLRASGFRQAFKVEKGSRPRHFLVDPGISDLDVVIKGFQRFRPQVYRHDISGAERRHSQKEEEGNRCGGMQFGHNMSQDVLPDTSFIILPAVSKWKGASPLLSFEKTRKAAPYLDAEIARIGLLNLCGPGKMRENQMEAPKQCTRKLKITLELKKRFAFWKKTTITSRNCARWQKASI